MVEIHGEEPDLFIESFSDLGRCVLKLVNNPWVVIVNVHRAAGEGFLLRAFFNSCFKEATISPAVLNGPAVRPRLTSSRDLLRRASMTRRCAGVYSSSAFGNFERSMMVLGVRTIFPRSNVASTKSPFIRPALVRIGFGMVSWPLSWILMMVAMGWLISESPESGTL